MQGKKAFFGAKDTGSVNVLLPIAKLWREAGGELFVIVEGLAGAKFVEAGFVPYFMGTENFQTAPFTLDVPSVLKSIAPDVVILCGSTPVNLEREIAQTANALSIPLVAVDDLWGGFRRLEAAPGLVLTFDRLGQRMARNSPSLVVGNPGAPGEEKVSLLKKRGVEIRSLITTSEERVIAYISGDRGSTEEEINLLIECLKKTPGSHQVVVSFHPKWEKVYGVRWREMLGAIPGVLFGSDLGLNSETLVAASNLVVAGVSTVMTTAAMLGKPVVSLATPEVQKILLEVADLDEVPQVSLGLAYKVTEPTNLLLAKAASEEALAELRPYNPELAYGAICSFLES